jgi:hypothetical protein
MTEIELTSAVVADDKLPPGPQQLATKASVTDYIKYLQLLHSVWTDAPAVSLSYNSLSFTVSVPEKRAEIPSIRSGFINLFSKANRMPFDVYCNLSGVIKPGRMTLVLAPPGAGSSAFLKTLAGHNKNNENIKGQLFYNSFTAAEQLALTGLYSEKLCALVAQGDNHNANLTVRETLQFAYDNSIVQLKAENFGQKQLEPQLLDYHARKVELLLEVLGLNECANTIVGNEMVRGISGG